ncbi:MAG: serine/threonine protein kinase [Candidatus Saccharimonas sp.]|nr:serine/threonine protein kinase [Planctomycetaceae bacterium]
MASSQLKSDSPLPPDSHSGSGQGPAFPFAWRGPAIPGSETVITSPLSPATAVPGGVVSDAVLDQSRRLFPTAADADDVAGVRIGHFTIQRRVGIGGMGSVFLATDERLRRNIALKILAPSLSVDPSSVQRFQNEARAAARLDHDNIARVFFYGEDSGLHYIAYEYVAGSNLRDVIRLKGKLDPAEAVNYAMQLAAALSHTSAAGVVHRDIKPSNILITPQRRAKLVDLGLARRDSHEASAELTVAGTTLGTFDYISPEQAKDPRNVDVRSDIYSLGCTLYHMLTGEPPYAEGTVLQKLLDHQGKEAPDPARKNRRVSPALSAVVRRMMASDPRRRYANPGELLRDLLIVARSLGSGAVPIDGQVWLTATRFQPPAWQRNIGWIATAAALILLVVAMDRYPSLLQRFDLHTVPTVAVQAPADESVKTPVPNSQVASASGSADGDAKRQALKTTSTPPTVPDSKLIPLESVAGVTQGPLLSEGNELVGPGERILRPIPLDLKPTDGMFEAKDLPLLSSVSNPRSNGTETPPNPKPNSTVSVPARDDLPPATAIARPVTSVAETVPAPTTPADAGKVISILDGKTYNSLEAACAEARDGSIIELRYNGGRGEAERPIRLSNKKNIIVRGGIGFRPLIAFAPIEPPNDATQSRMITVTGGSLELVNVDLTFAIPERIAADRWALFSLERPEKLQLHGVTITVANPNAQPACVIEQVAAAGQGLGNVGMMKNGMPAEPPKVSISESLVRGECDLILLRDAVPVRFQIKDVLVALQGSLFHAMCQTELANVESERVTLELDHATCCLSEGLIVTEGIDNLTDRTPPMLVIARNNILSCGPNRPLIAMKDAGDLMDMQRLFFWNGDRNYYDSMAVFWQLGGRQPAATARQLDFDAWRNYWGGNEGTGSTNAAVVWRTKPSDRTWTKMTADAVELNTMATSNPAVNGASDGTNAGVTLSKLPSTAANDRAAVPDETSDDVQ